jgi:hypothetical protein
MLSSISLQGSLISICLVQLNEPNPLLRQWLAICLGRLWNGYDQARWSGVRDNAHEKLYLLLEDPVPEVLIKYFNMYYSETGPGWHYFRLRLLFLSFLIGR